MRQPPLLDMRDLGKTYGDQAVEIQALVMVNLQMEAQSHLAVTGPSGSGKSSLLSIMGLLDRFTTGGYSLNGLDTAVMDPAARAQARNRHFGYIFPSPNLMDHLTAAENVALPLTWRDDLEDGEKQERTHQALEKVGLRHRSNHRPGQLSPGQQQRIAVARALIGQPQLILADEPTEGLDSNNAAGIMDLLETVHQDGTALCLATRSKDTAARAPRVLELLDGRIVADQTP